jgi:hypothetical protein
VRRCKELKEAYPTPEELAIDGDLQYGESNCTENPTRSLLSV